MSDERQLIVDQNERQRRAHSAAFRMCFGVIENLQISLLHGLGERERRMGVAAAERLHERVSSFLTCQLAAQVSAHTVGDQSQRALRGEADVKAVLIGLADLAGAAVTGQQNTGRRGCRGHPEAIIPCRAGS
jgi:hypothetical protein